MKTVGAASIEELVKMINPGDEGYSCVAQRELAVRFGVERGWKLTPLEFSLEALAEGKVHNGSAPSWKLGFPRQFPLQFDHPYYYRKSGRAIAVATHLYDYPNNRDICECVAEEYGLKFEHITDYPSWWYPGWTKLVLWTAAS